MSRDNIPAAVDTSYDDAFVIPVWFVELDFDTDPLYLHTDLGDITTLSHTWIGTGGLGAISPIEETEEVKAVGLKLRLDMTDEAAGSIFQELTQQDFYQRECIIYTSTRDVSDGSLHGTPYEVFRGYCDVPEITAGHGVAFAELLIESEWSDGEKAFGELYSDAQLRSEYSGDTGFSFLTRLINARIGFGTSLSSNLAPGGGGRTRGAPYRGSDYDR